MYKCREVWKMRKRFEQQMADLNNALIEMGSEIEFAIATAVKALLEKDSDLAKKAIDYDDEIDAKEKEIESLCLKLLLQQQPVASDLRFISSALKMITDMERIGDHSSDISEITVLLVKEPYIKKLEHIPMMAEISIKMINTAIDAFVKRDLALAGSVIAQDDVIDDLYVQVRQKLIDLIHQNDDNCEQAFDFMAIAKYFERIADHAVNIAEWVEYSITGVHRRDAHIKHPE